MKALVITTKRIYEATSAEDGVRVLVDRIWPRGIKKTDAQLDYWAKAVAPSTELRKWFNHDPAKWAQFCKNYTRELDTNKATANEIEAIYSLAHAGRITLLYAAHDNAHNNAIALKDYISRKFR